MEMSEGRVQVCLDNPGGLKLMSVCQWAGWPAIRNPLTRLLIISLVNSLRLCARARERETERGRGCQRGSACLHTQDGGQSCHKILQKKDERLAIDMRLGSAQKFGTFLIELDSATILITSSQLEG